VFPALAAMLDLVTTGIKPWYVDGRWRGVGAAKGIGQRAQSKSLASLAALRENVLVNGKH